MNTKILKEERISIRASSDIKEMIAKAATLSKISFSEFLLKAAQKEAQIVLKEHDTLTLSNSQRDWFVMLLDNPPQANDKLESAIERQHQHLRL